MKRTAKPRRNPVYNPRGAIDNLRRSGLAVQGAVSAALWESMLENASVVLQSTVAEWPRKTVRVDGDLDTQTRMEDAANDLGADRLSMIVQFDHEPSHAVEKLLLQAGFTKNTSFFALRRRLEPSIFGWVTYDLSHRKNPARPPMDVIPVPERLLGQYGLKHRTGGRYWSPSYRKDLTGQTFSGGLIDVTAGPNALFQVSGVKAAQAKRGNLTRANLFRDTDKATGDRLWRWNSANQGHSTLVLVDCGSCVLYGMRAFFDGPVTLQTYPKAPGEPKLRPTTAAQSVFMDRIVGVILREQDKTVQNVYETISIVSGG